MTQKEYLERFQKIADANVALVSRKNADYGNEEDAFKNFTIGEAFGVDRKTGVLTRMIDKLMRVSNLLKRQGKVSEESVMDTLDDLSNYAIILRLMIEDEKPKV